jgi:hypothetical protein
MLQKITYTLFCLVMVSAGASDLREKFSGFRCSPPVIIVMSKMLSGPMGESVRFGSPFEDTSVGTALANARLIESEISSPDSTLSTFFLRYGHWRSVPLPLQRRSLTTVDPAKNPRRVAIYRIHWGQNGRVERTSIVEGQLKEIPRPGPLNPDHFVVEESPETIHELRSSEVGILNYATPEDPPVEKFSYQYADWHPIESPSKAASWSSSEFRNSIDSKMAFYVFNQKSGNARIIEGQLLQIPGVEIRLGETTYPGRFIVVTPTSIEIITPGYGQPGDVIEHARRSPDPATPMEITPTLASAIRSSLHQRSYHSENTSK